MNLVVVALVENAAVVDSRLECGNGRGNDLNKTRLKTHEGFVCREPARSQVDLSKFSLPFRPLIGICAGAVPMVMPEKACSEQEHNNRGRLGFSNDVEKQTTREVAHVSLSLSLIDTYFQSRSFPVLLSVCVCLSQPP